VEAAGGSVTVAPFKAAEDGSEKSEKIDPRKKKRMERSK